MRKALLYIFIIFISLGFQTRQRVTRWVVTSGCSLKVDGKTNINTFSCAIMNYNKPDTILVTRSGNFPIGLNGNIQLDVQNFDCHNPIMTADLRKTLKAKEFPKLIIRFLSMNKYPDVGRADVRKGQVLIELAGVVRRYEVDYKTASSDASVISLVGTRQVLFSEFNLSPPRKLGGMIKTNNELTVVFNIRMKVMD